MKIRAAVLEEFAEPLVVQELDLSEPRQGEALVRLVACGAETMLGGDDAVERIVKATAGSRIGSRSTRSIAASS